ncbi:hypothetical protein GW17_00006907, partial [Ensete ventricosum]
MGLLEQGLPVQEVMDAWETGSAKARREEWKERPRVGGAGEPNPCSISSQVPPSPFVTTLSSELTTISSSSRPTRRSSLISSTAG